MVLSKKKNLQKIQINGNLTQSLVKVMQFINLYFVNSVATIVQGFSVSDISMCSDQTVEPDFKFGHFSWLEVLKTIKLLQRSKVSDVFGIGTIMTKDLRDTGIWKSVVVTQCWWCPISILPVFKMSEKLVEQSDYDLFTQLFFFFESRFSS